MKVLIVDDSAATRFILGKMMRELSWETIEAADGAQALEKLQAGSEVALALVDWNMPVMNGYELVQNLRANRTFDPLRIVMVTTETEMTNVVQAIQAGANEYIMKPFTKDILVEKLRIAGFEL